MTTSSDKQKIGVGKNEDDVSGTLNLKDSSKYQAILDQSLDAYKSNPETEEGEDVLAEPVIHESWNIRKIRILGSLWFTMVIFLFLGNLTVWLVFRSVAPEAITLRGAEEELQRNIPEALDDIRPFEKFIALSAEVTDSDYSSFLQAVNDINKYFPRQEFDITAHFTEEGFHFQNQGIYYLDPQ